MGKSITPFSSTAAVAFAQRDGQGQGLPKTMEGESKAGAATIIFEEQEHKEGHVSGKRGEEESTVGNETKSSQTSGGEKGEKQEECSEAGGEEEAKRGE